MTPVSKTGVETHPGFESQSSCIFLDFVTSSRLRLRSSAYSWGKKLNKHLKTLAVMSLIAFTCAPAAAAEKVNITILAPSILKMALPEIIATYGKTHPDVNIVPVYGGTGIIASEIKAGQGDVAIVTENGATDLGSLVANMKRAYATHTTISLSKSGAQKIHKPSDIANAGIRVGGATSASIAGKIYDVTLQKMDKAYGGGFLEKYNANVLTRKTEGIAIEELIEQDVVDAAVILSINITPGKATEMPLPENLRNNVEYVMVDVKSSQHPNEANEFEKFLAGPESATILKSHRFDVK